MADSRRQGKRERLVTAASRVLHEQGVERTTLADIATAADVPVGNVYYYFKTKDALVEAAIGAHAQSLQSMTAALDEHESPRERLKALLDGWSKQRDLAARFGCPFGTLSAELGKHSGHSGGLDRLAATVMQQLIDWVQRQFEALGRSDAHELAVALIASYEGIALLTHTFHDPKLMTGQIERLKDWIDSID